MIFLFYVFMFNFILLSCIYKINKLFDAKFDYSKKYWYNKFVLKFMVLLMYVCKYVNTSMYTSIILSDLYNI